MTIKNMLWIRTGYKNLGLFLSIPNKACYITLANIYSLQPAARRSFAKAEKRTSVGFCWYIIWIFLEVIACVLTSAPLLPWGKTKEMIKTEVFFLLTWQGKQLPMWRRKKQPAPTFCLLEIAICCWFRKCHLGGSS